MTDFEKLIDASKRSDLALAKEVLAKHPEFINRKDETGATAFTMPHSAAIAKSFSCS